MVNMDVGSDGDRADKQDQKDHSSLDIVGDKRYFESTDGGVDRGDDNLDNDRRKSIKAGENIDELLETRQLSHHVEEQGDKAVYCENEQLAVTEQSRKKIYSRYSTKI